MDTVWSYVRRLIAGALVVLALSFATPVFARTTYDTASAAMAACQEWVSEQPSYAVQGSCTDDGRGVISVDAYGGGTYVWDYTDSPLSSPCTSGQASGSGTFAASSREEANAGQICDTSDYKGTTQGMGCVETFSAGYGIANSAGGYVFSGTYTQNGSTCQPGANGSFTATGASASTSPGGTYAGPGQPAQKSCNGGSCVDPTTGQACIVDQNGKQFCTPTGSAAASPAAPSPSSPNCYSDGSSATLCVGATPPAPSHSSVTNPATQISNSDTYTVSSPGSSSQTTVNVYNTSTGTTSSGQTANDSGQVSGNQPQSSNPAHASSAGGNGTLSGGGNCDTPPVCTGDSVLCGIARTQWATTCQLNTDLAGPTGAAPPASGTAYSASQVWTTPTTGNTIGDAANVGNYDESGGGATAQCPLTDFSFASVHGLTVHLSQGCAPLNWLALAGMGFALFAAARITAGSNT